MDKTLVAFMLTKVFCCVTCSCNNFSCDHLYTTSHVMYHWAEHGAHVQCEGNGSLYDEHMQVPPSDAESSSLPMHAGEIL